MYVVQRTCRAGQRGTERTCENGADRQFRNTFRKNGSIREIRKKSQQSEKKTQESSETKDAKASAEETAEPQEDAVTKALREQSAALMDDQKSEILAKAQQTAQNSGYGMVQYHYCVVTNGEVGSVEDFSNAVFRILNSEHGWARRRDFRTFYGRQLRFQYRARPSVDLADVLVGMFGAIQLPCGQQCDYQRRSLEFRHGRVDVGRRRLGAISHDGDQS